MNLERDLRRLFHGRKDPLAVRKWRCPTESDLSAYAEGLLNDSAQSRVKAHLSTCSHCLAQVVFLQANTNSSALLEVSAVLLARAAGIVSAKPTMLSSTWRWATLLGATACLAVLTVIQQPTPNPVLAPRPPGPIVAPAPSMMPKESPSRSDSPSVRGGLVRFEPPALVYPREGVSLTRKNMEFRWKGTPRSLFYEIRVTTVDGSLIWGAKVDTLYARVPENIQFNAGETYYVWVVANLPEGKSMQSRAVAFRAGN